MRDTKREKELIEGMEKDETIIYRLWATFKILMIIAAFMGLYIFLAWKTSEDNPKPDPKRDFAPECEWCDD